MAECNIAEMERADIVFRLIEVAADYPLHYYVDAARDFKDFETAKNFLNQECLICMETYPIHDVSVLKCRVKCCSLGACLLLQMVSMPGCTHSTCKDCFREHFKVVIKEQGVKHFNCPICGRPDVTDTDQEFYFQLFQLLVRLAVLL